MTKRKTSSKAPTTKPNPDADLKALAAITIIDLRARQSDYTRRELVADQALVFARKQVSAHLKRVEEMARQQEMYCDSSEIPSGEGASLFDALKRDINTMLDEIRRLSREYVERVQDKQYWTSRCIKVSAELWDAEREYERLAGAAGLGALDVELLNRKKDAET